ncbi:hypothetical protein RUM44_012713 [Polyplax serrata]|uniref:Kinetochore protein NDC80 n=1 Tax=Polyplax serrata TaxID=468196 RepID=A0ABR1BE02_POLSC
MAGVGWTKRSSKTNRISYTQFLNDLGRQSQSVERPSRIPLRSSSQSGRDRGGATGGVIHNQNKQRSKSQASVGVSETPLSHMKFTPSQFSSRMTSGASSNASCKKPSSYKDPRNLQDKEFQKEATHLVQSYFQEKCPEILINGSEIKPMTIKMFIAMINHLFDVLGILDKGVEPVRFAVSSYEKELPFWMKKLEYPGLITKAWLQTVNVPQYWPHVVGLLSWLVKLCNVTATFNVEEQLNFPSDYVSQSWAVFIFKKSMEAFRYYNAGKEEEYRELCVEVVQKFNEINGLSEDVMRELQEEIDDYKKKVEDPTLLADKDSYDELEQQLKILESQHQKLVDDIERKEIYIDELKSKSVKSEKNCLLIKCQIEDSKKEIERLKTIIATQSTSVNDIADIQKKTEYLDKEIKCLTKECEDYSQLISQYEVQAAGARDKILQSSHAFNRSIIQLEQMIPELSKFHIHVDLESENVLASMEETVKSLESLKNTYVEKCQSLEDENIESHKIIQDKKQQLELLQQAIKAEESKKAQKMMENAALIKSFEDKIKESTEEEAEWLEKIDALEGKLKEVNAVKENKKLLEERHESLLNTLDQKQQFWAEFWNQVEEKWRVIPTTLESVLDKINKQNKELEEAVNRTIKQ